METIIHCECDCLYAESVMSSDCRKRYFKVLDLFKNKTFYLGICNQHLSLLINQKYIELCSTNRYVYSKRHIYEKTVRSIISKYVDTEFTLYSGNNKNDLINLDLRFTICKKPNYTYTTNIKAMIPYVLKNRNRFIESELFNQIELYLKRKDNFKKYKTKYKDCFSLIRKIYKSYNEERELLINKLFITIYELNIKEYETSK